MNIEKVSKADGGLYVSAPRSREYGVKDNVDFERTTVQIPVETMRRFNQKTKGGKAMCLTALLNFAMDALERDQLTITIN